MDMVPGLWKAPFWNTTSTKLTKCLTYGQFFSTDPDYLVVVLVSHHEPAQNLVAIRSLANLTNGR